MIKIVDLQRRPSMVFAPGSLVFFNACVRVPPSLPEALQLHNDEPAEGGRPPVTPCKRSAERSDARSAAWGSEPLKQREPAAWRANESCSFEFNDRDLFDDG